MKRSNLNLGIMSAALGGYAVITALISIGYFVDLDLDIRNWLSQHMPQWFISTNRLLAHFGQGGPLTWAVLFLACFRCRQLRSLKPALLWLTTFVSLVTLVGSSKIFFRRGAPADPQADAVELFSKSICGTPECQSYPSGHAANAVVWYGLAIILLGSASHIQIQKTAWLTLITVVAAATVISGYHWMTDTISGIACGIGVHHFVCYLNLSGMNFFKSLHRIAARPKIPETGAHDPSTDQSDAP